MNYESKLISDYEVKLPIQNTLQSHISVLVYVLADNNHIEHVVNTNIVTYWPALATILSVDNWKISPVTKVENIGAKKEPHFTDQ